VFAGLWIWIRKSLKNQRQNELFAKRSLERRAYELEQLTKQQASELRRATELQQLTEQQALHLTVLQNRILELEQQLAQQAAKVQRSEPTGRLFTSIERKLLLLALDQGAAPGEWATAAYKLFGTLRNRRVDGYAF